MNRRYMPLAMVAALAAAMLAGCKGEEKKRADEILASGARQMVGPQEKSDGTKLVGCTYQNGVLTYRHEIGSDSLMAINIDSFKAKTIVKFKAQASAKLIKAVLAAKSDVQYVYVCDDDSISFTITPDDIK